MTGYYESPVGVIAYEYQNDMLIKMGFVAHKKNDIINPTIHEQLHAYFSGSLKVFQIDLELHTYTPFQQDVFHALLRIPYGTTKSYKDIAKMIGRPFAYRAVGQACKKNPIAIIVPCHRVIGSDKQLTGYRGKTHIDQKKKLLNLEKQYVQFK